MAWIDPIAVIAPSKMFQGAVSLLASGQYAEDILLTLQTVAAALVISVITGFGLGLLLFRLPRLKAAADPFTGGGVGKKSRSDGRALRRNLVGGTGADEEGKESGSRL